MAVNLKKQINQNVSMFAGDALSVDFQILPASGIPVDIAGANITFSLSTTPGGVPAFAPLTTGGGTVVITDHVNGKAEAQIAAGSILAPGTYYWQARIKAVAALEEGVSNSGQLVVQPSLLTA